MTKVDGKRHWQPSEEAFQRLLTWLDEGTDSHGERYVEIRDRLVHYFARRNCLVPEDLADETLNRVARRLDEAGSIDDITPARYCYIVAKFVLLESLRQRARQPEETWDDQRTLAVHAGGDDLPEQRDRIMACLERCLEARTSFERTLILEYYRPAPGPASIRRKQLAERLGLTPNSLAIRACRIRGRLEMCVRACLDT